MNITFLVINLDRGKDRWAKICAQAEELNLTIQRVSGVDGACFPRNEWIDVDQAGFASKHGRFILPGEYGCYRSHLKALEIASLSSSPYSIIAEDDLVFKPDTLSRIKSVLESAPSFDIIKLTNHRVHGFIPKWRSPEGDVVGRAMHGPLGSAAAYIVSTPGAGRLCEALKVMSLPYDIALERHWATKTNFYTVRHNLINLSSACEVSSISPSGYKTTKFPAWQRLPTLMFRIGDYFNRVTTASL